MAIDDYIDKRCFVPAKPGSRLSAAQAELYNEQGWILLEDHVPRETLTDLRARIDALLVKNHRSCKDVDKRDPALAEFCASPYIQGTIDAINGRSRLLQSFAFCKLPGEARTKPWHQDGVYWEMNDSRVTCAFVALTESTLESGCIHGIPGSHLLGRLHHRPQADEFGLENLVCDISAFREPVTIEARPGDMLVMHTLTIHASFANRSPGPRINLGFHFQHEGTEARFLAPYRKKTPQPQRETTMAEQER